MSFVSMSKQENGKALHYNVSRKSREGLRYPKKAYTQLTYGSIELCLVWRLEWDARTNEFILGWLVNLLEGRSLGLVRRIQARLGAWCGLIPRFNTCTVSSIARFQSCTYLAYLGTLLVQQTKTLLGKKIGKPFYAESWKEAKE